MYRHLRESKLLDLFPGKIQIFLEQRYRDNSLRNAVLLKGSSVVSSLFDSYGIQHSIIKGITTLPTTGWHLGDKIINDIDLLIGPKDLYKSIELLQSSEFKYGEYSLSNQKFKPEEFEDLAQYGLFPERAHHMCYPFCKIDNETGTPIRVELHVSCGWRNMVDPILSTEEIISHSEKITIEGYPLRAPSGIDQIYLSAIQIYHDLFSVWDSSKRLKDSEVSRFCEFGSLIARVGSNKDFSGWIPDDSPETLKRCVSISMLAYNLLRDQKLDELCPNDLSKIGLSSDSYKSEFSGTVHERLIDSDARREQLCENQLNGEQKKRTAFWNAIVSPGELETISFVTDQTEITDIKKLLIDQTLNYVKNHSPFYRSLFENIASPKLVDCPLIEKDTLRGLWGEFVSDLEREKPFIPLLTGSTSGLPLLLFTSQKEAENLRRISPTDSTGFTLRLDSGNHGPIEVSENPNQMTLPIKFREHFQIVWDYLKSGAPTPAGIRKITRITGGVVALKRLLVYGEENQLTQTNKLEIVCSGALLTKTWRERFMKAFNADVLELYGLAEFCQGIALKCPYQDCYHFPLTVHPEILPRDANDIHVGELLLSHIYPFSVVQPILRYKTGDLVLKVDQCSCGDNFGIKFLGRRRDLPTAYSIPISIIAEVIERKDWAVYRADSSNFKRIIKDHRLCNAVFQIIGRDDYDIVRIECTTDSADTPDVNELLSEIESEMAAISSLKLKTRPFKIELLANGSLGNNYVRY